MGILDSIKKAFTGDDEPAPAGVEPHPAEPEPPLSAKAYRARLEAERQHKDHYFKHDPYSPIEDRANFTGLSYYPPDLAFRYVLPLQPAEEPEQLIFQTNTGDEQPYYRIGTVEFEVDGEPAQLALYRSPHHHELFLPFRDATSGRETYGAGRYLEPVELNGGQILVDFNLAYNPFCIYSSNYSCPLPPFENHLEVPIRAGEKDYQK